MVNHPFLNIRIDMYSVYNVQCMLDVKYQNFIYKIISGIKECPNCALATKLLSSTSNSIHITNSLIFNNDYKCKTNTTSTSSWC